MQYRIGNGIDIHQLEEGIPLIIGGISIPFKNGSKGHSDGDVLFHAIVDAILGSLSLGDIGKYFPSDNSNWKNADSRIFLEHAFKLINEQGYSVENIDATIILQEPIINSHILYIRENIASILSADLDQISVKATTTDKLGFIGKGEGIAATASVLIKK
tara:strand:+ start:233 stop:709 length:477 start_codon:yes stop_codon:yes gene_type:complete